MPLGAEHSTPAYTLVPTDALDRLCSEVAAMRQAVSQQTLDRSLQKSDTGEDAYVEPGPQSPRKWFLVEELEQRWDWKKSKLYALTEEELPYWKHGGSGRRYFWAHVWAFEQRITREKADQLFHAHQQIEDALQARTHLLHPDQKPAGLRKIS